MPKRIQLRRSRGWRMPPNTVKVDRSTRWGNPYKLADYPAVMPDSEKRAHAIDCFRKRLLGQVEAPFTLMKITAEDVRRELRGKDLACWCAEGEACHGDVLLEVANA